MTGPANPIRGEVEIEIDGRLRRLRLTLGALAELEGALKADGLPEVAKRLSAGRASDIAEALSALMRAAGEEGADDLASSADPVAAARAVAAAFAAADAGEAPGKHPAASGRAASPSASG